MPTRAPSVDHRRLSGVILEGYSVGVVLGFFVSRPPLAPAKAFSRSGFGRIFPLFPRVMREGLSTGRRARSPKSFSQAPYSLDLMTLPIWCRACSLLKLLRFSDQQPEHFDAGGTRRDGTEIERSPLRQFAATRPNERIARLSCRNLRLVQRLVLADSVEKSKSALPRPQAENAPFWRFPLLTQNSKIWRRMRTMFCHSLAHRTPCSVFQRNGPTAPHAFQSAHKMPGGATDGVRLP